jgi:hypothetical protein
MEVVAGNEVSSIRYEILMGELPNVFSKQIRHRIFDIPVSPRINVSVSTFTEKIRYIVTENDNI